jgi:hypothetical protein
LGLVVVDDWRRLAFTGGTRSWVGYGGGFITKTKSRRLLLNDLRVDILLLVGIGSR